MIFNRPCVEFVLVDDGKERGGYLAVRLGAKDQANGDRPKGGPTAEGGNVEIRPPSFLAPEVQMSFLCSGSG